MAARQPASFGETGFSFGSCQKEKKRMEETGVIPSAKENSQQRETEPLEPSRQSLKSRATQSLGGILATLVTIYGVLIAIVIFSSSQAQGLYYDNVFISQSHLSDASELSLEAQLNAFHDLNVLEQMRAHELSGADPELIEYLYGHLSASAQASLIRSGDLDGIYADEMYAAHLVERERAMRAFDLAAAWSERSGTYEVITTILAVGLAFAAWASLIEKAINVRWMFTIISTLILVGSLGFLAVHLVAREPLEEYISYSEPASYAIDGSESATTGELYVHPSGAFEFAIPAGWELVEEDNVSALIGDGQSAAGVEFATVERVLTEDEMRAYATDFVAATLEGYQIETLDVQPELTYANVSFMSDGSDHTADFFFQQQETVVFVLFFATSSEAYDLMLPTRDKMLDTFQGHPEAVQASP
jgi:hypothetical protein